jgi:hypothetical protein
MSQKPDAAPEPWPVLPNVNPGQPVEAAKTTSGERVPAGHIAPRPEAAPQGNSEAEEAPATLTSRLSGLRNLLFVMGVKDPHGAKEQSERPASASSDFDLRNEPSAADRAFPQDADKPAPINVGGASPRLITAPPEFLPPKSIVINVDKEDAHAGESSTRQDRRAAYDEIEILPSRRGQYKRI